MEAPLINEYKLDLVKRRLWQTFLGGPKLRLIFPARFYVYLVQVLLLLMPFACGIVVSFTCPDNLVTYLSFGAAWMLYGLVLRLLRKLVARKESNLPRVKLSGTTLGEEDTIPVGGCLGQDTLTYIIPPKKYAFNVALHTLVAGAMMATALAMLMPGTVMILFKNAYFQWFIIINGWFAASTAYYSCAIATPPETATFRAYDPYELNAISRPIHVILVTVVHIIHRFLGDSNQTIYTGDIVAHISFSLLPFFWVCGLLPPLEPLLLWVAEQVHIFLCGGPSTSSPGFLLLSLLTVTLQAVALSNFIRHPFLLLLLSCISGYIISRNIRFPFCTFCCGDEDSQRDLHKTPIVTGEHSLLTSIVKHVLLLSSCIGLSVVLPWIILSDISNDSIIASPSNMTQDMANYVAEKQSYALGWTVVAILAISCLLSAVQRIFFLGMFRNPLFRVIVSSGTLRKVVEHTHKYLLYKIVPLLLAAFLTCNLYKERNKLLDANNSFAKFVTHLVVLRSYRYIWQDSCSATWEVAILHILKCIGPFRLQIIQIGEGICLQLVIINFLRHRILDFLTKSQACLLFLFARPGSRHNSWLPPLQALSMVFFPAILAMVALTALFAAPLLPLFTLPIFFMSFPRPSSFWPKQHIWRKRISITAEASDAVYYQQALCQVTKKFFDAAEAGALGSVRPRDHFLLRFEDRLMWYSIGELGHDYHVYIVRGLELQETSCHTLEAAHIDGIFDLAFGDPDYPDRNENAPLLNPYVLHTLTPLTQITAQLYSDTKNVLTGVLDSPDTLHVMGDNFCKVLAWLLVKNAVENISTPDERVSQYENKSPLPPFLSLNDGPIRVMSQNQFYAASATKTESRRSQVQKLFRSRVRQVVRDELRQRRAAIENTTKTAESHQVFKRILPSAGPSIKEKVELDETDDLDFIDADTDTTVPPPRAETTKSSTGGARLSVSSLESWPDDDDPLETSTRKRAELKKHTKTQKSVDSAGKPVVRMRLADLVYDLTLPGLICDEPRPPNKPKTAQHRSASVKTQNKEETESQSQINNSKLDEMAGTMVSKLDLPKHWYLFVSTRPAAEPPQTLSRTWLRYCLRKVLISEVHQQNTVVLSTLQLAKIEEEVDHLQEQYEKLVNMCAAVVSSTGFRDEGRIFVFPKDCYTLFNGELPPSEGADWLQGHLGLLRLVLQAHRISVKLSLDQVLTGDSFLSNSSDEVTSMTGKGDHLSELKELEEALQELMDHWYVGPDGQDEWRQAVLKQVPGIFGIGYHAVKATFTSRMLTLQEIPVRIGRLNAEVVHGIWASLALELLYLTNDDDERFSIQAHPGLLRNLTTQAADPPLGYPVFVAETLTP